MDQRLVAGNRAVPADRTDMGSNWGVIQHFRGGVMVLDWWHMSIRLRRFLMKWQGITVFGFKWTEQCGHWVPVIVRIKDAYKEGE